MCQLLDLECLVSRKCIFETFVFLPLIRYWDVYAENNGIDKSHKNKS